MTRAYEQLRDQVIMETRWAIDSIKENHPDVDGLAIDMDKMDLIKFIGNPELKDISDYERGMMFAYLSIMSKIRALEGK